MFSSCLHWFPPGNLVSFHRSKVKDSTGYFKLSVGVNGCPCDGFSSYPGCTLPCQFSRHMQWIRNTDWLTDYCRQLTELMHDPSPNCCLKVVNKYSIVYNVFICCNSTFSLNLKGPKPVPRLVYKNLPPCLTSVLDLTNAHVAERTQILTALLQNLVKSFYSSRL